MDTRSDIGFGYSMSKSIESFWIGVVESVKKLKSVESMPEDEIMVTSLTGRPGMSTRSQKGSDSTRVKLGKHLTSNGGMSS
jgi:hypothetical protein